MKLGVDLSIMDELLPLGPKYFYHGEEVEPFSFFASKGISMVRLRLWHDPYDENGNPYGGGTCDLPCIIRLAKKANACGMAVMLDFHYSDFWVDPSRQRPPKAWKGMSFAEVIVALHDYTRDTLLALKKENIDIAAIQVGNEITNGMMHPYGELYREGISEESGGGYDGLSKLLKAGFDACYEVYPEAKTVLHLEHSGSMDKQIPYLENVIARGVEFDVVGQSYYPFWHGPFRDFKENNLYIMEHFHKEVWVVEAGYEWIPSRIPGHHGDFAEAEDGSKVGDINGRIPFPSTKQGQADYLRYFLKLCKDIGVGMVYYWEPAWVPMPGNAWAKDAGQVYCGLEPGPAYNDWENEVLFDFDGNANPAVDVFSQEAVDAL